MNNDYWLTREAICQWFYVKLPVRLQQYGMPFTNIV